MRITLVSRIFAPEPAAASERLSTLCREMADEGDSVTVITSTPGRGAATSDHERRYRVKRWPVLRDRHGYVRGYLPYLSFDIPAFFRVLFARRPDVVVVEPPPTTGVVVRALCGLRRIPYVYYAGDIVSLAAESTGAPRFVVRVVRAMERWALSGAAGVLAVTGEVADRVAELAPRAAPVVVGHGVDEQTFHADVAPHGEAAFAVYVGTASEWHGAGVLIEALAVARRRGHAVRAAFIGQGSDWGALQDLVAEHHLADLVSFGPLVPAAEAARVLRGAHVALSCLRADTGYDFAVPTKAYSAVAVGTPVIYAGPEPTRSLINENGLGVGCDRDPEVIADALISFSNAPWDEGRRRQLAQWAHENLSGRAVARRAAAVVRQAARPAGRHGPS